MNKLNENHLIIASISISSLGIILIYLISSFSDGNYGEKINPNTAHCGDFITFDGLIVSQSNFNNVTIIEVSSNSKVIIFDSVNFKIGELVKISGTIQNGKSSREIIAEKIIKIK